MENTSHWQTEKKRTSNIIPIMQTYCKKRNPNVIMYFIIVTKPLIT